MNSLKFNEVDWTIVVKKVDENSIAKRREATRKIAEEEAKKKAEEAISEVADTKTKDK